MENERVFEEKTIEHEEKELVGLGGWMTVAIIRWFITLFTYGFAILQSSMLYLNGTMGLLIDEGGVQYNPGIFTLINIELVINFCLMVTSIVIVCLVFAKKRIVPKLMLTQLVLAIIFIIGDGIVGNILIPGIFIKQLPTIIGATIGTILMILYILKSRRVKNTFVN